MDGKGLGKSVEAILIKGNLEGIKVKI